MDVVYTEELPYGFTFEVNGVLVIGTKKEKIERIEKIENDVERCAV